MKKFLLSLLTIIILLGAAYVAYSLFIADDFDPDELRDEISKEVVVYTSQIDTQIPIENESDGLIDELMESIKPGERDIVVPVKVTVKSVMHCSEIENINIDEEEKVVSMSLPRPEYQVDGVVIDWDNITKNVSWYRDDFSKKEISELVEKAVNENDEFIKSHKSQLDRTANSNAQKAINDIAEKFGFKAEF